MYDKEFKGLVMLKRIRDFLQDDDLSIAKAALYYMVCQILVKGMSFITTPIFSRILSKEEYGNVSNFFAWQALLLPLVTLDLRVTINRSRYEMAEDNDSYLSTILLTSNVITILALIIIELNQRFFVSLFSMDMKYIRILLLYIIFQTAFDYQQIQYNIFHRYKLYVFYTMISVFTSLALSVVLVLLMDNRFEGRIYGGVIPAVIIDAIIYFGILKRSYKPRLKYVKYAINIAVPLIPSALSSTILSTSDRAMITGFCGSEQTALYSIAYSVSSIAGIIWQALNQAWGPWLYDHLNEKKYADIKKFSNKFSLIYGSLAVGIILISPEIVYFMGGKEYMETVNVMPPVILAMVFQFFYAFYFDTEYFYGETYVISIGTGIAAMVNIALNFVFIPRYGYIAAAYTTMIGYLIMLIYHFLIVKFKLKKSYIYDTKYFIGVITGLVMIQLMAIFIYQRRLIRYAIIILYSILLLLIIWRYRESAKNFIEKFKNKKRG